MTMRKHKNVRDFKRTPEFITAQYQATLDGHGKLLGHPNALVAIVDAMKKAETYWLQKVGRYEKVPTKGNTRFTQRRRSKELTQLELHALIRAESRRMDHNGVRARNYARCIVRNPCLEEAQEQPVFRIGRMLEISVEFLENNA